MAKYRSSSLRKLNKRSLLAQCRIFTVPIWIDSRLHISWSRASTDLHFENKWPLAFPRRRKWPFTLKSNGGKPSFVSFKHKYLLLADHGILRAFSLEVWGVYVAKRNCNKLLSKFCCSHNIVISCGPCGECSIHWTTKRLTKHNHDAIYFTDIKSTLSSIIGVACYGHTEMSLSPCIDLYNIAYSF